MYFKALDLVKFNKSSIVRVLRSKKKATVGFLRRKLEKIYQSKAWDLNFKKMHMLLFLSMMRLLWKQDVK